VATQSARQAGDRPFYAAYGWAYDLLITYPVRPWADMVSAALDSAGIAVPARILDAGCGTGRHAAELARRGYRLDLVDASACLLGQARARLPHAVAHRADLCTLDLGTRYDAITCRGMLNDLLHDQDREAAIAALARHLHGDGLLFLDVRDMDGTRQRYARGLASGVPSASTTATWSSALPGPMRTVSCTSASVMNITTATVRWTQPATR